MSILKDAEKLRLRAEDLKRKNEKMSLYEAYVKAAREINNKGD